MRRNERPARQNERRKRQNETPIPGQAPSTSSGQALRDDHAAGRSRKSVPNGSQSLPWDDYSTRVRGDQVFCVKDGSGGLTAPVAALEGAQASPTCPAQSCRISSLDSISASRVPDASTRPSLKDDDLVGAAQGRVPVRYDQRRHVPHLEEPLPEQPLRLDVQCAGEVVEDQEI